MTKPRVKIGPIPSEYYIFDPRLWLPPEEEKTLWEWIKDYDFSGQVYFKVEQTMGYETYNDKKFHYPMSIKLLYFELESDLVMLRLQLEKKEKD